MVNPGMLSFKGLAPLIWCLKSLSFSHGLHLSGHGLYYRWNMIVRWNNFIADSFTLTSSWCDLYLLCFVWGGRLCGQYYAIQTQKDIYVLGHSVYSCSFCLCLKVLWYIKHRFMSFIIQPTAAVRLHHFWYGLKKF